MGKQQVRKLKSGAEINKGGRPPGSPNKRTLIREALQDQFPEGELGFWQAIATQASEGDLQAAAMLADRLFPKLKPQSELTAIPGLKKAGSLTDKAKSIIDAVAEGKLSTSAATELLQALGSVARIQEITELVERIEKLEERDNANT